MIPETYRIEDGCWNCNHVFLHYEYDEGDRLFCTIDGKERPLSGSVGMNEQFSDALEKRGVGHTHKDHDNEYGNLLDSWYNWSDSHEVAEYGVCNDHIKSQKKARHNGKN